MEGKHRDVVKLRSVLDKVVDAVDRVGDQIHPITSSLNRYGQFIVWGESRVLVDTLIANYEERIDSFVTIS